MQQVAFRRKDIELPTRRPHEGGEVAEMVLYCLAAAVDLSLWQV